MVLTVTLLLENIKQISKVRKYRIITGKSTNIGAQSSHCAQNARARVLCRVCTKFTKIQRDSQI